jgi:hypothetical protein
MQPNMRAVEKYEDMGRRLKEVRRGMDMYVGGCLGGGYGMYVCMYVYVDVYTFVDIYVWVSGEGGEEAEGGGGVGCFRFYTHAHHNHHHHTND